MSDAEPPAPAIAQTHRRLRTRKMEWAEVRRRAAALWWLPAAAAIGWVTWPYPSIDPKAGVDPSWAIGLHLAVDHGLDFGNDILFTYGPLGFLSQPLLVTNTTGILAFAFAVVMQLALCAALLWSALRVFPAWLAVLLTYAVGAMLSATGFSNLGDYAVFLVFVLAVYALESERPPGLWLIPLAASLAALQLLIKTNGGIVALALLALVVWRCRPGGWRSAGLLGGCFTVAVLVLWFAGGNSAGALPTWLREEFHVVTSYTDAMAIEGKNSGEYLQAALFLLVAAAALLAQVRGTERRRQILLVATAALYALAYVKEGFIRHDVVHSTLFFCALAVGLLAFAWGPRTRWIAATAIAAALGAVATGVGSSAFAYRFDQRADTAVRQAYVMVRSHGRRRVLRDSRAAARAKLDVDERLVRLLRGHTVDVEPYEASAIWAYGLRWRPQRFIQSYMATDHALDVFNAKGMALHGAERILLEGRLPALDDKSRLFMAPESYFVLLCRYRLLTAAGKWAVFARTTNRCGGERRLRSVSAVPDESVQIPRSSAPDQVVYARIHASPTLRSRLASIVFKPVHHPTIAVGRIDYRLVADTARGPLVLRLPRSARIPPGFGERANYSTLALHGVASPYRIDFFVRRVR